MQHTYELIRDADFIALFFLACLVFSIGIAFSDRHPRIWHAAAWLGAITLLGYVARAITLEGYDPLDSVAAYILRGVLAGAFVVGCTRSIGAFRASTWHIIAPIATFNQGKRPHNDVLKPTPAAEKRPMRDCCAMSNTVATAN